MAITECFHLHSFNETIGQYVAALKWILTQQVCRPSDRGGGCMMECMFLSLSLEEHHPVYVCHGIPELKYKYRGMLSA